MNTSYSIEITVATSPDEILATIHNPRSWWSEGITGSAGAAGDVFDYRYGTVHSCRARIAEIWAATSGVGDPRERIRVRRR